MESMYKVSCHTLRSVATAIHRFMTNKLLVQPECTIWPGSGAPTTIVNNGAVFITEQDLFRKIMRTASASISCVASTDKADTRRVVLTYVPGLDFMVLNFPQSNGRLTNAEKRIVEDMGKCNEIYS